MISTADLQTDPVQVISRKPFSSPCNNMSSPCHNQLTPTRNTVGRNRCISCSDSTYPSSYEDDYQTGSIVYFCRSRGHGFIRPENNFLTPSKTNNNENSSVRGEDIFVHISDIDSDYVPRKGDRVSYRLCPFPPKFEKYQAVNVRITSLSPQPHNRWDTPQKPDEYDGEQGQLPAFGDV